MVLTGEELKKFNAYCREPIVCSCGLTISRRSKSRHLKSKKHQDKINSLQDRITELETELLNLKKN